MKKSLLLLLLFFNFTESTWAQNKLYLPAIKYTATGTTAFNQVCYQANGINLYVNNTLWVKNADYTVDYAANGIFKVNFDFGKLKPGDIFEVRDACGSTAATRVVEDDFVYVEVPAGGSHGSNNIGPNDESAPYGRLSTAVNVGKCEAISVNAHGLHQYTILVGTNSSSTSYTSGQFLINGNALNAGNISADLQGSQAAVAYTINGNGSITYNGGVAFKSNTYFSGRTPFSLEYRHNGVLPFDVQEFGLGALYIRMRNNNQLTVKENTYTGTISEDLTGNFTNSIIKITYDGASFKLFIDGTLRKTVARSVIYSSSNGAISNGGLLAYGTGITWNPANSGEQWVSVIVDGVLFTRQKFNVAEDMIINESVINVACYGGNSGQISINMSGGQSPYQYSKDGISYQTSNTFTGLVSGNYTIHVRDASGCTTSKSIGISQNPTLTLSEGTKSNVNCVGQNNGSVTLNGAGGIGTLQYGINNANYQTSNIFNGLNVGTYTFWVRDGVACTQKMDITIGINSTIDATIAITNATCYGEATGSIKVTKTGITSGTVQYSLDGINYQTADTFSGLAANTYSVNIKDDLCSVVKGGQVIQQPSQISPNAASIAVTCFGLSDGKITITPAGGNANYTFSLDGTNYSSPANVSHTFQNLSAGNYKIWVKDANGCTKDQISTINQPGAMTATITSKTDIDCFGANSGIAVVGITGGNGGNTFKIGTTDYGSNGQINNLSAGTYTITTTDAKACQTTTSVEILQSSKISISPSINKTVTCFGGNDGRIIVNATGGSGGYTYSINNSNYQTTNTFDNLTSGSYSIYVKDNKNCVQDTSNIALSQPAEIIPAIQTFTNVLCFGGNNGNVIVNATGGVGNYVYAKDNTNFGTSGTFAGLVAATYIFTIKDGNSCIKTISQNINQPTDLVVSLANTLNVLCYDGNSGKITASGNGGTTPYQYSLNGTQYVNQAISGSHLIDTLKTGTFKVWVKDAHGCIKETNQVTLTQPTIIVPSISNQTNVSCYAGNDGSIILAATGGTGAYNYAKDGANFSSSSTFSTLNTGNYLFTIRDGNGCTKTITTTIIQPTNPYTISLVSKANLSCYQNTTGVINVTNSGGTSPYQTWITTDVQEGANRTFSNLSANNYTIHGKDAKGCTFDLTGINLSQPTDINIQLLQKKDVDCDYYSRGEALVRATGSNEGFSYTLGGFDASFNPIVSIVNSTGLFQQLKAGDYTLVATDKIGCQKDFTVTIISKNTNINFDINKTLPGSCLATDGSISLVNISGGRQPYQFSISGQNTFSGSSNFANLLNGVYILTVADSLCSYKKEVDLKLPNSISAGYIISPINCSTPNANLNITPVSGGNGNYQFSLNGAGFTNSQQFNNLHPNIYSVTVKDNPLSCQTVVGIEIKEQNRADLQFVQRVNVLCYGNHTGVIEVKGTNNLAPFQYALNSYNFGGSGLFQSLPVGEYKIYAKNSIGCMDSLRATLTQPTLLVNTATKVDNLCFSDSSASITLVGSGGVSPYTYSINGNQYQNDTRFGTLRAGTYTTYVKDAHNCITPKNVDLIQPGNVIVTPQYTDVVRCWGESNGKVTVIASGGTPAYQYSMDNQSYFESSLFQSLPVGNYTFYVKDANQCVRKNTLILTQPDSLKLSLVKKTNPLCFEGKDGTILVNAIGGNGSNSYTLNNTINQENPYFGKLNQGNYVVTVTDQRGCIHQVSNIDLKHPTQLQHQFSWVEPLCFSDANGKITINVAEGTPQYKIQVDGQTYQPNNGTQGFIFDKIPSRTYVFTTIDANACEDKFNVNLPQPSQLKGDVKITENNCFGDSTGIIQVFGKGATAPYQYAILNSYRQSDSTFTGTNYYDKLRSHSYTVRFKDNHSCRFDTLVTVQQPTLITFIPLLADSVRCFNEINGRIAIQAQGGTPSYVYGINNQNYQKSDTLKNLKEGFYQLYVKDSHGCIVTQKQNFYIPQPKELLLTLASKADPLCLGESNGRIMLNSTGGNGQYTFVMDNRPSSKQPLFEGLTQGEYTFKATDWKGCQDTITLVRLKWPAALKTRSAINPPKCIGDANGTIALKVDGGIMPYRLSLDKGAIITTDSVYTFSQLISKSYTIQVKDHNGCELSLPLLMSTPEPLMPISLGGSLKTADSVVCKGQVVTLNAQNAGKEIHWYKDNIELTSYQNKTIIESDKIGVYSVIVKNATGCMLSDTFSLKNSSNALIADFLLPVQVFVGDEVVALDITKPIPDRVIWTLPAKANILEENKKRIRFSFAQQGTYSIDMQAFLGDCITRKVHTIQAFDIANIDQTSDSLGYGKTRIIEKVILSANPNYGIFNVEVKLNKSKPIEVTIIRNATGQEVYNQSIKDPQIIHKFPLDLKIRPDIYILVIRAEESVVQTRFVILN